MDKGRIRVILIIIVLLLASAVVSSWVLEQREKNTIDPDMELQKDLEKVQRTDRTVGESLPLTLRQGNAIDLSAYEDDSYDIVLLFGPLYHLHKHEDRLQCITEAKRVCKPDGAIFFAVINNDMVVLTEMDYDPHWLGGDTYDHDTFKVVDFPFVFHTVDQCRQIWRNLGSRRSTRLLPTASVS